ncbi:carbohydrate kinase family protein [Paenibacillus sp.]|uniref:carbohydrate kinase family protein n=1 Tax=Paenibacillus sp. TaxID=58172 RepID=UPI002D4E6225|nr:carbohydrate kinase family protein [Paenibacillus sp.]HZG56941.1 carbohydrate kinase family protein [Paenibacillus sp.]
MAELAKLSEAAPTVAVCGHIAVDIIPKFEEAGGGGLRLTPGSLLEVGEAAFCTGGAVSNTGIALHRLGANVRLVGKVSDDVFGALTIRLLRDVHPALAEHIAQVPGETSSYTIVVNPPGMDRIFLHCPGTNDTFSGSDIDWERLAGATHFHFGYPPLMRGMYADGGDRLAALLRRAKESGMTVSLDMAMPGKGTAADAADWIGILKKALPYVDVFLPSLEETLRMAMRDRYEELCREGGDLCETTPEETIRELGERLLDLGCGIAALKLGASGLYLRSGERGFGDDPAWRRRELWAPCFRTTVAGTTGAGDCTIAGFLNGLLHGLAPEDAITGAVAVGAFSVERLDATSGIAPWDVVQERVRAGWDRLPTGRTLTNWRLDGRTRAYIGPADETQAASPRSGE